MQFLYSLSRNTYECLSYKLKKSYRSLYQSETFVKYVYINFSLGGTSPFHGNSEVEVLRKIQACDWSFDDEMFKGFSAESKDFISKLLVKEPRFVLCIIIVTVFTCKSRSMSTTESVMYNNKFDHYSQNMFSNYVVWYQIINYYLLYDLTVSGCPLPSV